MKRKMVSKMINKTKKISKSNGSGQIIEQKPIDLSVIVQESDKEEEEEELDSDEELQKAFAEKRLTPGLNVTLDAPREHINNTAALKRKLEDIYLDLDFHQRLDITMPKPTLDSIDLNNEQLADNDFKREHLFFRQAQTAVIEAFGKLKKLCVQTKRPEDYFAEMAKSDEHMKKVKEALLSKHAELEKREKVRKLRELKKLGKQIQVEQQQKKHADKRRLNDTVKKIKKGDREGMSELENEIGDSARGGRSKEKPHKKIDLKKSKKTLYKDKKFGFGGKKKRSKYNTADSSADYSDLYGKKNGKRGNARGKSAAGAKKFNTKKFKNKNKK